MEKMTEDPFQIRLQWHMEGDTVQCSLSVKLPNQHSYYVKQVSKVEEERIILAENDKYGYCEFQLSHGQSVTINVLHGQIPIATSQVVFWCGDERIKSRPEVKVIREWNTLTKIKEAQRVHVQPIIVSICN